MNRTQLIKEVADILQLNNVRKNARGQRHTFTITDEEGHSHGFTIKEKDRALLYTQIDVDQIIDGLIYVIGEALKQGESVSIRDFGSFGLKKIKAQTITMPGHDEPVVVGERFLPKFTPSSQLKDCAKVYMSNAQDALLNLEPADLEEGN